MILARPADAALTHLDAWRSSLLKFALRLPLLGWALQRRDARIMLVASLGVCLAFVLMRSIPMTLFLVGPVILGIPHVVSDVRYLIVRRDLPRWFAWSLAVPCVFFAAIRSAELVLSRDLGEIEIGILFAWMGFAVVIAGLRSRRAVRTVLALAAVGTLFYFVHRETYMARLLFAHLHNVMAIVLWVLLFRTKWRYAALPIALVSVLTLITIFTAQASDHPGSGTYGISMQDVSTWMAPGLSADLALGVTFSYVFLQAIHYGIWLRWIPEEDTQAEGTLTFRMTVQALLRDLRPLGIVVIALGMIGVGAFAFKDVHRARDAYLSIATFHGYLELVMLLFFLVAGTAPRCATR